jgi:AcrR family transcriptional regulator
MDRAGLERDERSCFYCAVGKGETTRAAILEHAARLARRVGLEGLSIGRLAKDLHLSKSGLFAHFRSKESLQIQVLDTAAGQFVATVIRPALARPRGEPRLTGLFEAWLDWARSQKTPGGCLFVAAAVELDDRPGPVRRRLVRLQREWLGVLARVAQTAIGEGYFGEDVDAEQFAHDLYGVMLGYHHASRLLKDPRAERRATNAFERLLEGARRQGRGSVRKRAIG